MITKFGKLMRIYRMDHGLLLKDMAEMLDVPSSYLSAMEMGRKAVSKEFLNQLLNKYEFTDEECTNIIRAAQDTVYAVKINLGESSLEKRNMALSFARKFDELSDATASKILEILNKGGNT